MANILLVEDNAKLQRMVSRQLKRLGYNVTIVGDGIDVFPRVESDRPDLILMDVGLPTLDGLETTKRLKSNDATEPIPVIALTARAMPSERKAMLDAGCQGFQPKPIDMEVLNALIQSLLVVA